MEQLKNKSLDYFNHNLTDLSTMYFTMSLHSWVVLFLALPLICLAMYGLFSLVRTDNITPIYVINLLVSDVLQICTKPIVYSLPPTWILSGVLFFLQSVGVIASVFFMVCISGERYIMIAHPMWFRLQRTIKKSLICCAITWMAAIMTVGGAFVIGVASNVMFENLLVYSTVLCLLPYPFVLFFFIGTWRALSKSISLTGQEQRRIMGTLALVLFIYTVLFLPYMVMLLLVQTHPELIPDETFQQIFVLSTTLLSLNPLTDPILYVFARKKRWVTLPCQCCSQPPKEENGRFVTPINDVMEEETHV